MSKNIESHKTVVQNPAVRRGLEIALAHMVRRIADSAPGDMGACASAHLRVLGAHDLIATFYNLAETVVPGTQADNTNLPGAWGLQNTIYEGGLSTGVVVTQQALPPGPTWNQRLIVQFAPQLAAPAIHTNR